jgi:hypothetical protein
MACIVARIALNQTIPEDRRRVVYLSGRRKYEAYAAAEWRARMFWYPHGIAYARAHVEAQENSPASALRESNQRLAELDVRLNAIEAIPDPVARRLERLERHLGVSVAGQRTETKREES